MARKITLTATRKRVASQQMDLFKGARVKTSASGPTLPVLPEGARECAGWADHAADPGAFSGERDAVSGAGG